MSMRFLDGRTIIVPFIGAASLSVTVGDWKRDLGLPGQQDRAFFTRYAEEGSSGTLYQAGALSIIWEPRKKAQDVAMKAVGWLFAARAAMLKVGLLFTLGT